MVGVLNSDGCELWGTIGVMGCGEDADETFFKTAR